MSWNMHVPSLSQDFVTSWEIQTIEGMGDRLHRRAFKTRMGWQWDLMETVKLANSQDHTEYSVPKRW